MLVGDAEHEPLTGLRTVTVTGFEFRTVVELKLPPKAVQVAM